MNKKILIIILFVILLFAAGIIAVTQEAEFYVDIPEEEEYVIEEYVIEEEYVPPYRGYIYAKETPGWMKGSRWFRSNAGGFALEEVSSRLTALRNEYALAVDYAQREELPGILLPFYDDDKDYIEVRRLYENRIEIRTQWLFRSLEGDVRIAAAFSDQEKPAGFIEIFDDKGLLAEEYNYFEDDKETKTDYVYNNGVLISAKSFAWEDNNGKGGYELHYTDAFSYNRYMFLRAIERKYHKESEISFADGPVRVTLPKNIKDAVNDTFFLGARYNTLPEFFGVSSVNADYRMVYVADERSRIISQTLYDEAEKAVYVIENTWEQDRITSSVKTEGDTVLSVTYEYDSKGNRVKETNSKNGVIERVVRTEGQTEIEELYIEGTIALRAIWEDGRKISETRIRNR